MMSQFATPEEYFKAKKAEEEIKIKDEDETKTKGAGVKTNDDMEEVKIRSEKKIL